MLFTCTSWTACNLPCLTVCFHWNTILFPSKIPVIIVSATPNSSAISFLLFEGFILATLTKSVFLFRVSLISGLLPDCWFLSAQFVEDGGHFRLFTLRNVEDSGHFRLFILCNESGKPHSSVRLSLPFGLVGWFTHLWPVLYSVNPLENLQRHKKSNLR